MVFALNLRMLRVKKNVQISLYFQHAFLSENILRGSDVNRGLLFEYHQTVVIGGISKFMVVQ